MEKNKEFSKEEIDHIFELVKKYDTCNTDIKKLESNIQSLLKEQEAILLELSNTRKDEEAFFESLSVSKGLLVAELKKMAQSVVLGQSTPANS